jgi:hypothetical protein
MATNSARVFEAIKGGMSAQGAWDRYGIFELKDELRPSVRL